MWLIIANGTSYFVALWRLKHGAENIDRAQQLQASTTIIVTIDIYPVHPVFHLCRTISSPLNRPRSLTYPSWVQWLEHKIQVKEGLVPDM